jgi:hypothetical protein
MASNANRKEHHVKTSNRPSHRVYAVTKNGKQSFWQPIGAAWAHSDAEGFSLRLEYLPLNAEIVIRKPKVEITEPAVDDLEVARAVVTA